MGSVINGCTSGGAESQNPKAKPKPKAKEGMPGFEDKDWWKVLSRDAQAEELSNPNFHLPCAPTVIEKEALYVPQKFSFAEVFDHPLFQGRKERILRYATCTVGKIVMAQT